MKIDSLRDIVPTIPAGFIPEESHDTELLHALLPKGEANAISRKNLARALCIGDRSLRKIIERARCEGLFVCNSQNGAGYFLPDTFEELQRQTHQEQSRINKIKLGLKPMQCGLQILKGRGQDGNL